MGRKRADYRFQDLIGAATQVFLAKGYRRAQMADVAQAMGVAKGTVYLYVESKEALFDLVIRYADRAASSTPNSSAIQLPNKLPVPTPDPASTLRFVQEQLMEADPAPLLTQALQHPSTQVRSELAAILRQLYAKMNHHRTTMKLIDRCAHDYPELAAVFFKAGRETVMQSLIRYLELRIQQGQFRTVPDVVIAARVLLETLAYWAIHRYWDPSPQAIDDAVAEETVIHMLLHTLIQES
ncbi:MAG: TetR/AcrR family transcriptional regulator [Elainellaceae cyanobacterium]